MFSNKIYRDANDAYIQFIMGMQIPFYYDGAKGIKAICRFIDLHEDFELEIAMAYLDQINGIQTPFPILPSNKGGQLEEV